MDQVVLTNIIYVTLFLIGALLFGFGPIIICQAAQPFVPIPGRPPDGQGS